MGVVSALCAAMPAQAKAVADDPYGDASEINSSALGPADVGFSNLFSSLQLLCGFLLFFSPLRRSRRWLAGFALAVLAAKIVEFSWIVLPALEPVSQPPALLATLLSSAGLGCLLVASLPAAVALNRLLQPASGEAHS